MIIIMTKLLMIIIMLLFIECLVWYQTAKLFPCIFWFNFHNSPSKGQLVSFLYVRKPRLGEIRGPA